LPAAVHAHPAAVRTSKVPSPPPCATVADEEDSEIVQSAPWLTVKVRPAIVSDPDRAGPVVAATLYPTSPLPLPLAPDAIVIQDTLLAAVHAQPAPAVTETVPSAPDAGTDRVSGEIAKVQPCPCTTVTVWPATAIVPDRDGPLVDAAVNVTVPDPLPVAPEVMVIHEALLALVHAHPPPAVTATLPLPPAGGTVCVSGDAA